MFDDFVADLRCPDCGALVPGACIQTYIRGGDADSSSLVIGAELDPRCLRAESILRAAYLLVSEPGPGAPIRLLNTWDPRGDCFGDKWALITIADARIAAIDAVRMTKAVLAQAGFISDIDAELLAKTLPVEPGLSTVEILKKHLPTGD